MSTHPITKDTNITFPCWLWYSQIKQWIHASGGLLDKIDHLASGFTHYSTNPPDQRPEDVPSDKADAKPTPVQPDPSESLAKTLVGNLRAAFQEKDRAALDTLEIAWTAIISRYFEPMVRELAELQGKEEGYRKAISNYDDWIKRRTETVDQLRAEVERLTKLLKAATEPLPDGSPEADGPEKELDGLRADVRRLKQDNNNLQAINSDLVAGNERLRQERDEARSDADLQRTRLGAILWSGALNKYTAGDVQQWTEEYRTRVAELEQDRERLIAAAEEVLQSFIISKKVEAGHPCPENMVICRELRAAIDAARRPGKQKEGDKA